MTNEPDYAKIGARIRKAREEKGITQETLGEICQLSTSYIGHIERGTRIPSLSTLHKISSQLKVSLDMLISDSVVSDDDIDFSIISSIVKGKDKEKVKNLFKITKILADNINEL